MARQRPLRRATKILAAFELPPETDGER